MSVLAPAPDFAADNSFLYAVLGLVACAGAVERALDEPARTGEPQAEAPVDDDPVCSALLGVICLQRLLQGVVASWTMVEASPLSGATSEWHGRSPEDLLR